jgi:HEAT repeat protein
VRQTLWRIIWLSFPVAAVGAVLVLFLQQREPLYENRPLSYWLDQLGAPPSDYEKERAEAAVKAIGSAALPTLVKWMKARDTRLRRRLIEIFESQPLFTSPIRRSERQRMRAYRGFQVLGDDAIPTLNRLLNQGESAGEAALMLRLLGSIGLEPLVMALTNSDARVRVRAVRNLGPYGVEAKPYLPEVAKLIKDSDAGVQAGARRTLEVIGRQNADAVVPAVLPYLADTDPGTRKRAVEILSGFASREALRSAVTLAKVEGDVDIQKLVEQVHPTPRLYRSGQGPGAASRAQER